MNEPQFRPNTALRAARLAMHLSQDELAERMRDAGAPSTTKRTIQRYESGETTSPRPASARALESVIRLPIASLGFPADADAVVVEDGRGGHDLEVRRSPGPAAGPTRIAGGYSGIWLSRYEFFSSSRDSTYTGQHYVVLLQHDDRLTVRSLPGSAASSLTMDLTVDGNVLTGAWTERTDPQGHYKGCLLYTSREVARLRQGHGHQLGPLGAGVPGCLDRQGGAREVRPAAGDRLTMGSGPALEDRAARSGDLSEVGRTL